MLCVHPKSGVVMSVSLARFAKLDLQWWLYAAMTGTNRYGKYSGITEHASMGTRASKNISSYLASLD